MRVRVVRCRLTAGPQSARPLVNLSAAANLLFGVISPLAAADIRPPSHASVLPRVVDLSVAADEVLRVVRLVAAAHLLAVVLDLQVAAAADVALGVVGLRTAA